MIVTVHTQGLRTLAQVHAFVSGVDPISFALEDRHAAYGWMADTLKQFGYGRCKRADKGVLRQYLRKVTGLSRAQVARCIKQFTAGGGGSRTGATRPPYRSCDAISRGHPLAGRGGCPAWHALRHNIGERRKPFPNGCPGYLRVDSVHQGDLDVIKGVYLINAVDEVTQFQAVFAVEHISEAYLLPVLEAMMDAFPFVIRGFHSDNGSEYINRKVATLLEKLRIEQTKSRSRQTNDNALAESKNASTVRKYLGYSHIPQHCASQVNAFTVEVLSPYLNFHRPCHFPTEYTDAKGRIRKRYRYQDMMTPYEKLR